MATLKSSAPLREAFKNQIEEWAKLAELLPLPSVRASIIRARLLFNLIRGEDRAVQSAKLLGQDREINLWEPDVQIGIAIQIPPELESEYTKSVQDTNANNLLAVPSGKDFK